MVSDYAGERDHGSRGALHAAGGRRVSAGGERSGGDQHAVRRFVGGRALHDGIERTRHQPDAGRDQLHGGRGTALRDRRYHARRSGLGNIAPEQSDYHQVVKGGGNGNYRTIVLAPYSVQEMADLTALAFELADRYRNPVVMLADGFVGQMMEPVEFAQKAILPRLPTWAVDGTRRRAPT